MKEVKGELSAAENIDAICFSPSGILNDEFNLLYPALFDNAELHLSIKKHWMLDKEDATQLREKIDIFKSVSQTNKQVFLTLLSTFGIKPNKYSIGLVNLYFDMNILFEPVG